MNPQTDSRMCKEFPSQHSLLQTYTVLNRGTDEELGCWGYRSSTWKTVLFYIGVVLTGGLLLLVVYWKPELECYLKARPCALCKAKKLLLKTQFGVMSVVNIGFLTDLLESSVHFTQADIGDHQNGSYTESAGSIQSTDDTARLSSSWIDDEDYGLRHFDFQNSRYLWDQSKQTFKKLADLSSGTTCVSIQGQFRGLSGEERRSKLALHGSNVMRIAVPSYFALFWGEVLNPFYIFQIASIILWSCDSYYYYAGCIFLISFISIAISLYETKKQRVTLRDMVTTEEKLVTVCTNEQEFVEIPEHDLVPGDVIAIPANGCIMTCDAVLTAGNCIVNESMLTGESVPVTKTPLQHQDDNEMYSAENHKRHTLFAGTHIVQTRYYGQAKVTAVVVRTGFNTAKGELVRAILFPKPLDFQFYRDAIRFIMFLGVIASFGMVYSLVVYIMHHESVGTTILRVLDIITIVVPPALPAAMTVGTAYAQSRLKKGGIFCISPPRINFCGRIDAFCFDKTGTLTEDGLDMWGVVPVLHSRFELPVPDPSTLDRGPLLVSLAACHSLTIIDGEVSGDPLDLIMFNAIKWYLEEPGTDTHKFDIIMPTVVRPYTPDTFMGEEERFELLQREHPFEVGIIRQFTFSSSLQRMTVITRTLGNTHMDIYSKGAPEKIASLCVPETVPEDFHTVLHDYSIQGFRVIALGHRSMDPKVNWHQAQRISRDKVEKDLTFLGLLVMQNQLKPQTAPAIRTLKQANIRTIMVTGDMIQTAVSVARNCDMIGKKDRIVLVNAHPPDKEQHSAWIEWEEAEVSHGASAASETTDADTEGEFEVENAPLLSENTRRVNDSGEQRYSSVDLHEHGQKTHLAVSGKSFAVICHHFPELLPRICVMGTVFARMSPDQKCQLIEQLQKLDYIVGMCGDGANDCEALKAAHAGISLSEAEASVAAPFTSRISTIDCVITAMREGRAALVTSFGCFKYMALYSFIQFVSVLILYTNLTNLSDFEFLYVDLVITTSIAILLGNTGAYERLVKKKPPGSLVKPSNLLSIVVQVFLVGGFQMAGYYYLKAQPFYTKSDFDDSNNGTLMSSYNGTLVNSLSNETSLGESEAQANKTWESTTIFLLSCYMYISVAFTFSQGPPFRKPIYTNVLFLVDLILLFAFSSFMLLYPLSPIVSFMDMKPLQDTPFKFRITVFLIACGFIVVSTFTEWVVISSGWLKGLYSAFNRLRKYEPPEHKRLHKELRSMDWPDVGQVTFPSESNVQEIHIDINNSNAVH